MQRSVGVLAAVLASLLTVAGSSAAEVGDDPDLRVIRQALAMPAPRARSESAPKPSTRTQDDGAKEERRRADEPRHLTIRFRSQTEDAASLTVAIDCDDKEAGASKWLDALAETEVLSVEWDDTELAIRVD